MPTTTTGRDHLNWATNRALEYYDAGDKTNAFASFLSDVTKHEDTAWIAGHSATLMLLETGYAGGRDRFQYMMEGFAASDQLPAQEEDVHRAPFNTATEDGLMQAHFGALAGGDMTTTIKAQEAAGQASFVNSSTLPREMSIEAQIALRTAGVEFGATVTGDPLFVDVVLPEGWKRQGTSHDMHSDLLDDKGRKRAGIFYKSAFYDRRANLSIVARFKMSMAHDAPDGTVTMLIKDFDTEVFSVSESYKGNKYRRAYYRAEARATKKCQQWFNQNGFPEWENAGLYWD